MANELPVLLRTNTLPVHSHSSFPTAKPLVDPPTRSVLEEKADHWFTNTSIPFRERSIPGPPLEGHNFGTTGGVAGDHVENGGRSPRDWTSTSSANRLGQRRVPIPAETARALKSLRHTILGLLDGVLEPVELQGMVYMPSEDGGGVTLIKSSGGGSSFD